MPGSLTERDIVFFLGAGFSNNAGLPVMSQFGSASVADYKGLLPHALAPRGSSQFRNAAPMLVEAAEVFQQFQRVCERAGTLSGSDIENLETVFCVAEVLSECGQTRINLGNQPFATDVLIEEIQLWLWKIYQQCPLLNPKRETNENVYNQFFTFLKELRIVDRLTVVTTNYDLTYEYLSWKHGMPCVYHWPDTKSFKAGHGSQQYLYDDEREHPDKTVICKLHGSVNYFQDRSKGEQSSLFVASDLGDETPIGKSGVWKEKPALFAVDAIWNIRKKYGEAFTPVIVPPTYAKLTQQPWLREIWNRAFHALTNAEKIIFIGYSMPDSDGFMRALVHGALAVRGSDRPPKVYVIDKCEDTHKRYKNLFGSIYKPVPTQDFGAATEGTIKKILCT
jgi:hypothetical protein